jgi:hypothetical protein
VSSPSSASNSSKPRNESCCDLITDQEIAFARLILSRTMNDRRTAEAVGLNPETAVQLANFDHPWIEFFPSLSSDALYQGTTFSRAVKDQQKSGL